MNDLKNRCQKRKLKENVCKEKKRKAIESWKWQTYAVLLLAGMISLCLPEPRRHKAQICSCQAKSRYQGPQTGRWMRT